MSSFVDLLPALAHLLTAHLYALPVGEWLVAPVPEPSVQAPPGLQEKTDLLLGWLKWGGTGAGTAGIMIAGIMMAVGRRNRSSLAADGASSVPWVLGGCSLIAIAGGLVGAVLQ
jgi:hypothetical protein